MKREELGRGEQPAYPPPPTPAPVPHPPHAHPPRPARGCSRWPGEGLRVPKVTAADAGPRELSAPSRLQGLWGLACPQLDLITSSQSEITQLAA